MLFRAAPNLLSRFQTLQRRYLLSTIRRTSASAAHGKRVQRSHTDALKALRATFSAPCAARGSAKDRPQATAPRIDSSHKYLTFSAEGRRQQTPRALLLPLTHTVLHFAAIDSTKPFARPKPQRIPAEHRLLSLVGQGHLVSWWSTAAPLGRQGHPQGRHLDVTCLMR